MNSETVIGLAELFFENIRELFYIISGVFLGPEGAVFPGDDLTSSGQGNPGDGGIETIPPRPAQI